jgi:hypothetical protein
MGGATVGVIVAVMAWCGVWLYLRVLSGRLDEALAELRAEAPEAPSAVFETPSEASDEQ